jgi:lysophospholipase L1-like esterase
MRRRRVLAVLLLPLLVAISGGDPVVVHLAGDSTMATKRAEKRPETGWGEFLQDAFDSSEVRVVNHAQNGRSTRTFIAEGRWQVIVDALRPGDFVFIQFGHNDQSREKTDRYTPPDDFRANLARFVTDVRARGATPVLLTPVVRRRFDSTGTFYDVHGEYPDLTRRVAAELDVALIDMHRKSEAVLKAHGAARSRSLFLHLQPGEHANYPVGLRDDTHFSPAGAQLMASLAIEGIRESGLVLAARLRPGEK